jgi:protein-L-isoaspartate(D-aspartate) O-methyltransferase
MDHAVPDFATARAMMVDSQVRPNKVTDPRILAAMRRLPREAFVPAQVASRAYADEDVPLGNGRYLTEPMVIARLVQAASVRAGERALVVAAGTGYGAALLAECGATVTAQEQDEALLAIARAALAASGVAVSLVSARPERGWNAAAPYDLMLIEGAVEEVPPALIDQLRAPAGNRVGGRLLVVRHAAGVGQAMLGERVGDALSLQPLFDCAIPLLPALRAAPGFVF